MLFVRSHVDEEPSTTLARYIITSVDVALIVLITLVVIVAIAAVIYAVLYRET